MGRIDIADRGIRTDDAFVIAPRVLASTAIRVLIQQPSLPKYRIPVFRALAERPNIRLKVIYGPGHLVPNAKPEGFNANPVRRNVLSVGSHELWWSTPQFQSAGSSDVDVLMLCWNLHYASLIPALLRARQNGIATILWGHGYSKHDSPFRRWPREQVSHLATAMLLYNHATARHFIDAGHDPDRIFVAPNSLDQRPIEAAREAWLSEPEKLRMFQKEHDLIDRPMVLFVSRLDPDNRVDLLLHATARLARVHPRLHTVIIGSGRDESHLRSLARNLRIESRVRFLGAVYDEMQLAPWFLSANAFCYPRNIGLSIMHSFGYGLPVVTGDHLPSHNPEIEALEHGTNGLFFRDGHPASLADALHPLIVDRAFRNYLSENARKTVKENFTLAAMVDGMTQAIHFAGQRAYGGSLH